MKIGIMTYWSSDDNYGQQLQCFALQRYLREKGHDAFLIRYVRPQRRNTLLQKIQRNLSFEKIQKRISGEHKREMIENRKSSELILQNTVLNRQRKFENFRSDNIVSTDIVYNSLDELQKNPPQADLYICGSDQVWNNPLDEKETEAYFLQFGKKDTLRASYAASIGRELKKSELKQFSTLLSYFDAISVRETDVEELCHRLGFKEAQTVVDPTILLPIESFRPIYSHLSAPKESYILLYVLNIYDKKELYWNSLENWFTKKHLGVKIIYSSGYIPAHNLLENAPNILASIPEWLSYIEHASCVITTSFHGVVFCVKMHKPFLAVLLKNRYKGGNTRIVSFLENIGLSSRVFNAEKDINTQMTAPIDWDEVEARIATLRASSIHFIENITKQ